MKNLKITIQLFPLELDIRYKRELTQAEKDYHAAEEKRYNAIERDGGAYLGFPSLPCYMEIKVLNIGK